MDPVLLLSLIAAVAQPAGQPRAPDSHDLRRERGDVLIVDGQPQGAVPHVGHGRYAPPCPGWTYIRLRAGQRLRPVFLASHYTISNPAEFGLLAAGAGRRWIRYGDDAVLVGDRNRRVVQVVPDRYR